MCLTVLTLLCDQVHLTTEPYVYSTAFGDTVREKVNKNLFFDLSHSHLYITTDKKVCLLGLFCNIVHHQ